MQLETRRKSARNQKPDPPPEPTPPPKQIPTREKRKHTPAKEKTVPPAKSATPAPPPLPTKLGPGQPIPELKEPQPVDLPDSEWQTVTESGVLKAALERSRQKWMTPGIFQLYYSKAGKKRLPGHKEREKEKENNKDKDKGENEVEEKDSVKAKQMKREGNCKLYIDPHQWDITIWTMRENTGPPPPKPKPPTHQPANYGGQGQYHGGYAASHPYKYQAYNSAPKHPPPPPKQTPAKPPQPPPPARPTPTRPPENSNAAPKPAPDPVIHMLAERANTNYKLRDVMKIVARGDATKEQLEYFQGHITELNERLEAQKKAQAQAQAQRAQQQAQPQPQPQRAQPLPARPSATAHIASATPPGTPGQQTPAPPRPGNAPPAANPPSTATPTPAKPTPSASAPPNMPQQPPMTYYTPPPQPSPFGHYPPPQPPTSAAPTPTPTPAAPPQQQQQQPRPAQPPPQQAPPQPVQPPPIPQPTYRALCIDFNTNGDRLLFPRETILEALPGNQVLASFLKVQKIDLATMNTLSRSNTYYQALKEYYQPVTVRFRADNPAILACLWRWVKPADQVRKHMEEIMDRCVPAEEVEIAARLPREGTRAALGERDTSTPRESVERVETPAEGRDKKRQKRVK
ncbi:hypothetical protein IWZ00DRAFT_552455 [Phyllosticta capitalensis]|uniref:SWR1-complex protein 3 domain-containing protein n=1 Tax=Phyllosticta capitalensis TaxID=121624 RepID=A0ABR1YT23_9PEZI